MPETFESIVDEDNEEQFDEETGEVEEERVILRAPARRSQGSTFKPVINASEVPLFPDADKDSRNTIAYLKIIRESKPKPGYKGQLPPNATLESISLKFGNGYYTIEACSEDHVVLRRRTNVPISVDDAEEVGRAQSTDSNVMSILKNSQDSHQREVDRVMTLTTLANKAETERGREYTTMVRETAREARDAMNAFYQAGTKNQQDFFGALMASQAMAFQQTMALLNKGHEMQMIAVRENAAQNNPMVYVQMMMQGMQMGRDLAGDDDNTPDWIKGMREGGDMLQNLLQLKQSNGAAPQQNPQAPTKRIPPGTTSSGKKIFEVEELKKALALKETLREQGIDFSTYLEQARIAHHKASEEPETAEDDASDASEDDGGEEIPEVKE